MTTATTHTVLCPLGCGRQVSAEQDEIHYCVTTIRSGRKVTTSREYVGTWDGEAVFYGACHDEVERQLRPYREEQLAIGLTHTATELDGGMPEWEAETPVEPEVEVVEPSGGVWMAGACFEETGAPDQAQLREWEIADEAPDGCTACGNEGCPCCDPELAAETPPSEPLCEQCGIRPAVWGHAGRKLCGICIVGASGAGPCPNCGGTNIDYGFSPPRCRICDPIDADSAPEAETWGWPNCPDCARLDHMCPACVQKALGGTLANPVCTVRGCTRPATTTAIGWPVCAACDVAGMERLYRKVFEPSPEPSTTANPSAPAPVALSSPMTCECVACETVQPCYFDADAEASICIDRAACDARCAELDRVEIPPERLAAAERSVERALDEAVARMQQAPTRPPAFHAALSPTTDDRHPTTDTRPTPICRTCGSDLAGCRHCKPHPSARLIPCKAIDLTDPAIVARLAAMSRPDLEWQAAVWAAWRSLGDELVPTEVALGDFKRAIAAQLSGASTVPIPDDLSPVLFELALTDPPALAELLRAHTDIQREQLAWRYALWLRREHDIVREPSFILRGWDGLMVGAASAGLAAAELPARQLG
jgi:hypothetical protein